MKSLIRPLPIVSVMAVCVPLASAQCPANELTKLTASDAAWADHFGESVSISGDLALIGAHADDDAGTLSGSAYLYRFDPPGAPGSGWVQEQKLVASDAAPWDEFGHSVSISGDVAFIAAPGHDPGSVYVFRYDPGISQWIEHQKLVAVDGGGVGSAVSVEADVALIGAAGEDAAGQSSGAAYIFRLNKQTGQWQQQARLTPSDGAAFDLFGRSVSISGNVVLIGAAFDDDVPNDSGSAYVFVKPEGGWVDMTETAKLTASDAAVFAGFGGSVSMSAGRALVSAHNDGNSGPGEHDGPGAAYIIAGLSDCNDNAALDLCDIADGTSNDSNANGIPDECEPPDCPADLDGDATVGILDLLALLAAWGTDPGGPPDFDGDGTVGILDLLTLLVNWGPCS